MASSQKSVPKSGSRWNFISQAVASVESRLDTILADEEIPSRKPTPQPAAIKENVQPARTSLESPRGSVSTNDRLQERLARAMAKKNNLQKVDSPVISEPVSRTSTPDATSTSKSAEQSVAPAIEPLPTSAVNGVEAPEPETSGSSQEEEHVADALDSEAEPRRSSGEPRRVSQDVSETFVSSDKDDAVLLQVQLEHEDVKMRMQEEIQGYIERIDALNAKLQYLTKEAAGSAKHHATEAQSGSLERKILERDEKIALLMDEGQKLSMNEMKHLAAIKKLRAQASTTNKDQDAVRQRAERAEQSLATLDEKVQRVETNAKTMETKLVEATKKSQDLEAITRERNALNETLTEMREQVMKANARAETAESRAQSEQVEVEKARAAELQDAVSSLKTEHQLSVEKLYQEIKDLKSAIEKEKEQSRAMETEMLAEQATLETKLESLRVRAEEATSNDHGDAQAKLLRQIETLQSQYAAASQNWQGIEGSLLARITNIERERDEVMTRESEVRKKTKESTSRARKSEKELEDLQLQYASEQETQSVLQAENQRLNKRIKQLEDDLTRTQKETEDQKVRLDRDYSRRLEEERSRWAASVQLARTASLVTSNRKTSSTYDLNHLTSPHSERPTSRRSSTLVSAFTNNDSYPPSRHHSASSSRYMHNGSGPETPILVTSEDADEYFTGVPATPSSIDHTPSRRGYGDLISTSTVGVGPSVQLVERMSANVRRLESEKEASKDELARLTTQRDESRQEVVRLMREVEQKRTTEQRLSQLEEEHQTLNGRYQTTLELLGEKSEQVEELKADILDVKQMYRQLADHMK